MTNISILVAGLLGDTEGYARRVNPEIGGGAAGAITQVA